MLAREQDRIFTALDTTDVEVAVATAHQLKGIVGGLKLGLEFFLSCGVDGFKRVSETGMPIFLDLKFHDIPNTVAGAVRAVAPLAPKIITVHTQGGTDMMKRAVETAHEEAHKYSVPAPWVVGVTVLTSLDDVDLTSIGVDVPVGTHVARLAMLAAESGLDGMVCSPHEIALVRGAAGADFKLVVPGIRPAGTAFGDQKRVMAPQEAVTAGADVLVIGRPITGSGNPAVAAKAIADSLVL